MTSDTKLNNGKTELHTYIKCDECGLSVRASKHTPELCAEAPWESHLEKEAEKTKHSERKA